MADAEFVRGLNYLFAARRCEEWAGNDTTESQLHRLAATYRARGCSLMLGEICGAPGEIDAPLLRWDAHDQGSQERAMRGGDTARW